jgi:PII-like signaling protein
MRGYRIVFSTVMDRIHEGKYVKDWLLKKARELEISGVTVINASEGYGRNNIMHSASFFELADQPIEIIMLVDEEKCTKIFEAISSSSLSIFYSKTEAEFGFTS